jgi:S-adenosylmethionine-diacylglycerol 3-amino-3-carboxypropyl transferase
MGVQDWVSSRVFQLVHGHNLVYNTCWEDPRLDREAMQITPDDSILAITSAGCNVLDYLLDEPRRIYAVDMNPRQNALLELKLAGIRRLEYEDFYELFGNGYSAAARSVYQNALRDALSPWSQRYWDRWMCFFDDRRLPFYFRGTSGVFARLMNMYVDRIVRVRPIVESLLAATSVDEQRRIYDEQLRERFWTRALSFLLGRDMTLSLVGVPRAQRKQVERDYEGGIAKFVQDCLETVFARLPLVDNYFWRVYITGRYTPTCCPEYLKPAAFQRLKDGLADRIEIHTNSVQGFLEQNDVSISRFVLLDHMDWMSTQGRHLLDLEWRAIIQRATSDARFLWRSGGLQTDFVDAVRVWFAGDWRELGELLWYDRPTAARLHARDRVHTYGSFCIAHLAA